MSNQDLTNETKDGIETKKRNKTNAAAIWLAKVVIILSVLIGSSIGLSKLGAIHGKGIPESYFIEGYPSILTLLDSEVFMGFIFFVTVAIIVYILFLMWGLHEIAVHKAAKMSSAHTQIVFALSLCGLFIDKTWWVLAIIIAFTRWDVLADAVSTIIRKGHSSTSVNKES